MTITRVKCSTVSSTAKPHLKSSVKDEKEEKLNSLYAAKKWLISVDDARLKKLKNKMDNAKKQLDAYEKGHPYKTICSDVLDFLGIWNDKEYTLLKNAYQVASDDYHNFSYDPMLDDIASQIYDIVGYGYDD